MTTFVFSNFFQTTIAAAATSTATTISVASDANVPTISAGQQWAVVVQSANTPSIREVMYVTATSGTTFTVSRGQEGTAAQAWSVGDNVLAGNTAGQMGALGQLAQTQTWTGADTFTQPITALGPLLPNGFANMQIFTASGTWTAPDGVTKARVICTGGGGGGSDCNAVFPPSSSNDCSGGGGGSGGTGLGVFSVTPLSGYAVTVGAGGGPQGNGGTSSFGSLISATGGAGSTFQSNANSAGGSPGAGSGGSINLFGGFGSDGQAGAEASFGNGGASYWGGGSRAYNASGGSAPAAAAYGSGGGGAYSSASGTGGAGAGGIVVVTW